MAVAFLVGLYRFDGFDAAVESPKSDKRNYVSTVVLRDA